MPGWNPEPSSIQIARTLNRHVPQVRPSTATAPVAPRMGLRMPRLGRQAGGAIPDSPSQPFTGPIVHTGGGRTDDVPMHVPDGAYVLPADIVSHVGEGNSLSGLKVLRMMFGPYPYMGMSGPYGSEMQKGIRGQGPPPLRKPRIMGFPKFEVGPGLAQNVIRPGDQPRQKFGGPVADGGDATPIMASGGEFVITPQEVARRGGGNLGRGHRLLDHWVKSLRQEHIATLKKLPGPAK